MNQERLSSVLWVALDKTDRPSENRVPGLFVLWTKDGTNGPWYEQSTVRIVREPKIAPNKSG